MGNYGLTNMTARIDQLSHRVAGEEDLPALYRLIERSIASLQSEFLNPAQVAASHQVMGLDTQLLRDRTYLVVEQDGVIAGCGGWSYRATLYGGDASIVAREADELDPQHDAARIRAMYTDPAFARRGIGRVVLGLCEQAAYAHGFRRAEMMATMAGEPLYRACGYTEIERVQSAPIDGVTVPLVRMGKALG